MKIRPWAGYIDKSWEGCSKVPQPLARDVEKQPEPVRNSRNRRLVMLEI